jgi:hypothetical protein
MFLVRDETVFSQETLPPGVAPGYPGSLGALPRSLPILIEHAASTSAAAADLAEIPCWPRDHQIAERVARQPDGTTLPAAITLVPRH